MCIMCVNKNENKNTKKKRTEGKILNLFWPLRSIYRFPIQNLFSFVVISLYLYRLVRKIEIKKKKNKTNLNLVGK